MAQLQVVNSSPYLSAPTSPSGGSPSDMQFYSAPCSPAKEGCHQFSDQELENFKTNDDLNTSFDDFEFETSKKFGNYMELEVSENFECLLEEQHRQEKPKRERRGSLPTMAFADELFFNGQVMPLKLPPKLQFGNDQSFASIPSSPRSPTSVFKVPFVRRVAWNDDFDPFTVALQKVSKENRGRRSNAGNQHRRTRSHSPFRTTTSEWYTESGSWNRHQNKEGGHLDKIPKETKGSPYARWVLDQKKQVERSSKRNKLSKGLSFGRKVRPVKTDLIEGPNKPITGENVENQDQGNAVVENKMKGIKGILLKYASFGKENTEDKSANQVSTIWKSNYFKKLSFKIKGNVGENSAKKRVIEETKMALVEYKRNRPTLALCFHGVESPRNRK